MKLDAKLLRYLNAEDFKVLTAVEMGSRNHEIVPTSLITSLASLKHGGVHKVISTLAKANLIAKVQGAKYDGYRLTYGGYDYLALHALAVKGSISAVGQQIGVGKESDIMIAASGFGEGEEQVVLKIHRLGRTSFRTIKANRDYLRHRKTGSWKYLARLAAMKEFAFMKVLYENGFPVPTPIDCNRHCVVMELLDGIPLHQVQSVHDAGALYSKLMDLIVDLATSGLIHGDFNEFNLILSTITHADPVTGEVVRVEERPLLIDFPQMVSTSHKNAPFYFSRDVECVRTFFRRRFGYESDVFPLFGRDVLHVGVTTDSSTDPKKRLDVEVAASGFSKKQTDELAAYFEDVDDGLGDADNCLSSSDDEHAGDEQDLIESVENEVCGTGVVELMMANVDLKDVLPLVPVVDSSAPPGDHVQEEETEGRDETKQEGEEDVLLEENVNASMRPYRDAKPVRVPSHDQGVEGRTSDRRGLSTAEIKERVARAYNRKSGHCYGRRTRNTMKATRRQEDRQMCDG